MHLVAIVVGLILAALFEEWIALLAQNHPWRVAIVGGIVFGLVGLVLWLFPSGPLITVAVVLAGGWGIGLLAGLDSREKEVSYYCKYGAQSKAELDDCMESVNTDDIAELDTPAARLARGESFACGRDSGPYCAEAVRAAKTEYSLE